MSVLRRALDRVGPQFEKGGRFEKFEVVYEMLDTLLYTPPDVTRHAPHVRDSIDLKRVMWLVVLAVAPCALVGMWNTGYQANLAMQELGIGPAAGWQSALIGSLGLGFDPGNVLACFFLGLLYFRPIYAITILAGGFWEILFAGIRNHEVNEGFFVTSILYALILPATGDSRNKRPPPASREAYREYVLRN